LSNANSGETIFTYTGKNPTIRKSCEIKAGVTLCLPFDGETWNGRQSGSNQSSWFSGDTGDFADANATNVNKFRKNSVSISKNVKLTNNGNIQIGGILGFESQGLSGHTSGNYCEFVLDDNAQIISKGNIYCFGYIKEKSFNNGSKLIINSGIVRSPFVIYDYRGGTSTVGSFKEGGISPFNVYDLPNIKVNSTYSYNSRLIGLADLYTGETKVLGVTISAQHNTTDINIIGNSKTTNLITLTTTSSYTECKNMSSDILYTTRTDTSHSDINIYGGANNGEMTLTVKVPILGTQKISTKDCLFPISYKHHIYLKSGSFSFQNPTKVMNGSKIQVEQGANLITNSNLIIYSDNFIDVAYGGSQYPSLNPAEFIVDGSVTFGQGNGGYYKTHNNRTDYSYIYENANNRSVSSKEGYGTRSGLSFSFTSTNTVSQAARSDLNQSNNMTNLEQKTYIAEEDKDYFIEASNLGKYIINYHLEGGIVDGKTGTLSIEYPIVKNKNLVLNAFAISNPVKRFYTFNSRRLNSVDGEDAYGITVADGSVINIYATYDLTTYYINYNVEYEDDIVLDDGDTFTNNNILKFTKNDLPINISKASHGDFHFYGWYYDNDTTKEITSLNESDLFVGYDDINLNGYFSKSIMCAVSFNANGHDNYFTSLESFNKVYSSPNKVDLPLSSDVDTDDTVNIYLKGWSYEDGTIFDSTAENFTSEYITLYAVWGNKAVINYYADNTNNTKLDTKFYKPDSVGHAISDDEVNQINGEYRSGDNEYVLCLPTKWNFSGGFIDECLFGGEFYVSSQCEGQIIEAHPSNFSNEIALYYKVIFDNQERGYNIKYNIGEYFDFSNNSNADNLTLNSKGKNTVTYYLKAGTTIDIEMDNVVLFFGTKSKKLFYNGNKVLESNVTAGGTGGKATTSITINNSGKFAVST
ncbi:MAG: hypothetical protein MR550_05055, partial [Bacilli bacterium]|nr:hypothetical protein [Bacilli bacterium]